MCTRSKTGFQGSFGLVLFCRRSGYSALFGQLWLGRAQGGRHGLVRAVRAVSGAVSRIVYMHACVHVEYMYMHMYMRVHMYVDMRMYLHVHVRVCVCMHTCVCAPWKEV